MIKDLATIIVILQQAHLYALNHSDKYLLPVQENNGHRVLYEYTSLQILAGIDKTLDLYVAGETRGNALIVKDMVLKYRNIGVKSVRQCFGKPEQIYDVDWESNAKEYESICYRLIRDKYKHFNVHLVGGLTGSRVDIIVKNAVGTTLVTYECKYKNGRFA